MQAVFDRTQNDVDLALTLKSRIISDGFNSLSDDEQLEWLAGLKGCLNYTDLNRIENNCSIISNLLNLGLTTFNGWNVSKELDTSNLNRIKSNVSIIRSSPFVYKDTPTVPELPYNTYQKINDIEKILFDVYSLASGNLENVYYTSEIYCDDEIGEI